MAAQSESSSGDDIDEFDDMDNTNEANADGPAASAEQEIAGPSGDAIQLPTPPQTEGQVGPAGIGTEANQKHSNARDTKATGVARAAARLLQQDALEGGMGILSVRTGNCQQRCIRLASGLHQVSLRATAS